MQEGFYWVQAGSESPQVWYYLAQFGWYRPQLSIPVTDVWFRHMKYEILSDRLAVPEGANAPHSG